MLVKISERPGYMMLCRTKSLFISFIFAFLLVFTVSGTKAHKQELVAIEENLSNLEEGSPVDAKIWLANFGSSNPAQTLVLNGDGLIDQTPLSGGSVRANAASPSDSNVAYYLTTDRRIWKTIDGGDSFVALTSFDTVLASSDPNSEGTPIDIFTDPADPQRVWALVDNGDLSPQCNEANDWIRLYRSTDGGATWAYSQVIDAGNYCVRRAYRGMTVGNVIYIGGVGRGTQPYGEWHGVIYGSTDGGITWSRIWHNDLVQGVGAWDQSAISTITTPINGNGSVWYAGIKGGASGGLRFHGILRGSGGSWSYKPIEGCSGCFASNQTVHVSDVAVDASNTNIVLALVVGHDLYRSNDGGNTWIQEFANSQVNEAWRIEADPVDTGVFWLVGKNGASETGLYRSTLCGQSWIRFYDGSVLGLPGTSQTWPISALAVSSFESSLQDTDGDGLKDDWETFGYDYDGDCIVDVDLPAMGSDPLRKDIFIEIDYMVGYVCIPNPYGYPVWCFDYDHQPKEDAIAQVVQAFAAAPNSNPDGSFGITLHVDSGPDSIMSPNTGDTWGNLSEAELLQLTPVDPLGPVFYDIKRDHFSPSRSPIFRYGIAAHRVGGMSLDGFLFASCFPGLKGLGQGNDFILYLGAMSHETGTSLEQAIAFMHELGHNLGLEHGGFDSINDKPNYLSIMNYSFAQNGGLIMDDEAGHLDYSRFHLPNLDETNLNEQEGLNAPEIAGYGYGTYYYEPLNISRQVCPPFWKLSRQLIRVPEPNNSIDWNLSGGIETTPIAANINADINANFSGGEQRFDTVLESRDDWHTISLPVQGALFPSSGQPRSILDAAGEPNSNESSYMRYAVAIGPSVNFVAALNVNETVPITLTNLGMMTSTISLAVTPGSSWFDTSAIPTSIALSPGEQVVYSIPVAIPGSRDGDISDTITISATPQESPRMVDSATLTAKIGPMAWFEASPVRGYEPLTIEFNDLSVGQVDTWLWNFGDSTISTAQNPTHTYATPGIYQVTLTVTGPDGTNTYTRAPQIVVNAPPIIHSLPFSDDMEDPSANWRTIGNWRSTIMAHSSNTAWQGRVSESSLALVDQLDFSNTISPTLTFWEQFTFSAGTGQVVISSDDGVSWQPIFTETASISSWSQVAVDLSEYSGQNVNLAFYLREVSTTGGSFGWYIDDVLIEDIAPSSGTPTPTNTPTATPTNTPTATPTYTPTPQPGAPAAPTGLTALYHGDDVFCPWSYAGYLPPQPLRPAKYVALNWQPTQPPSGTTFRIYRHSSQPVPLDSAHLIRSNVTIGSWTDRYGQWGDYYVVTAVNAFGESPPSNTAEAFADCGPIGTSGPGIAAP
jgi:PKD repeat protein